MNTKNNTSASSSVQTGGTTNAQEAYKEQNNNSMSGTSISLPIKPLKNSVKVAAKAMNLIKPVEKYDFEHLQELEKRRRAVLLRVEEPWWKMLLHWDGTVVRILAFDFLFWFTVAIYIGVRIQARYGMSEFVRNLGTGDLSVLGGFMTFFMVFYVNQSHNRYFKLYKETMNCKGRTFDLATLAATSLPFENAHRLIRYMNAAHMSGFTGLSKTYGSGAFFKQLNNSLKMLTDEEMKRMDEVNLDQGGSANRELIAWSMMEVQRAHKQGYIDNEMAIEMRSQVLRQRAAMGQLYDAADLPIPFFYVHFIALLTTLYLPLFAVSIGIKAGTGNETFWTADLVGGFVVVFMGTFVIGLRILGQKISDPYGDDLIDLSVMHYVTFCWTHSNRILETRFQPPANAGDEEKIVRERKDIGGAWERTKRDFEDGNGVPKEEQSIIEFSSALDVDIMPRKEERGEES